MWKGNGKTTTLHLFLDSLSPKTEKLSLEEAMDLSRDRLILEVEMGSGTVIYVPSFIKIGSGVQTLIGEYTQTQKRDLISLLYFFKIRKLG
jgi:hypothetical protein